MRVVTPPTFEQITLEQARLHCRADDDGGYEDDLLKALIVAAREHAEQYTQRLLATQIVAEVYCNWPRPWIGYELPGGQVDSITSVGYTDTDGAQQTLPAADVALFAKTLPARWGLAYGASWPAFRRGPEAVEVTYVAGYAQGKCPASIVQGMLLAIGYWYENRGDGLLQGAATELPPASLALLRPWRISPGF